MARHGEVPGHASRYCLHMQSRYVNGLTHQVAAGRGHGDRVRPLRRVLVSARASAASAVPSRASPRSSSRTWRASIATTTSSSATSTATPSPRESPASYRRLGGGGRVRSGRLLPRSAVWVPSSRASSLPMRAQRASRSSQQRCAATTRASSRSCSRLGSLRHGAGAVASASSSSASSPRVPSRAWPRPRRDRPPRDFMRGWSEATSSFSSDALGPISYGAAPPAGRGSTSRPTGSTRVRGAQDPKSGQPSWLSTAPARTA
jgi:hypothetical protein